MQLSRQEIADTQIIVTTPEKWDVVTRKPTGEGELASVSLFLSQSRVRRSRTRADVVSVLLFEIEQRVKLLIIDEVHLLNEERGAVIETIVARTLRQVNLTRSFSLPVRFD